MSSAREGEGGRHDASMDCCLKLAAPIGLSPLTRTLGTGWRSLSVRALWQKRGDVHWIAEDNSMKIAESASGAAGALTISPDFSQ